MKFDPKRHTYTMREIERLVLAVKGTIRMNGRTEMLFAHPLMPRHCIMRANRDDAIRHLMTWVRQLYAKINGLKDALGFTEE